MKSKPPADMFNHPLDLPEPDSIAKAHSKQLTKAICQEINLHGPIPFARYMELALYAPALGYYSAGMQKFGGAGDFITAPEISPLFSHSIAQQCAQVLTALTDGAILEFGAGTGKMAADILLELAKLNKLPTAYYILEVSAELRQRQQETLQTYCPEFYSYVHWLDQLPEKFCGVMLANEVIDAMPVHRFRCHGQTIEEFFVDNTQENFSWLFQPIKNEVLSTKVQQLQQQFIGDQFYESEINLLLPAWINSLSQSLERGLILCIDYGFPRHEYYHPQRTHGTLMCHYQHRAHSDPLILTGLQDITAHVDFTSVAESALAAGLQIAGYTTQASFLINCGIMELCAALGTNQTAEQLKLSQQLQRLMMPHEMGELYKAIALTKQLSIPLLGFSQQDMKERL